MQNIFKIESGKATMSTIFREFSKDIKLGHSIFALPFVGVALTLTGLPGISVLQLVKILACMVLARSFAILIEKLMQKMKGQKSEPYHLVQSRQRHT